MAPRIGHRLTVRVTEADIGRRVTLRRVLADGRFADTVGVLESWRDGVLTVRRKNGDLAHVRADELVAGRVVPPHHVRPTGRNVTRHQVAGSRNR